MDCFMWGNEARVKKERKMGCSRNSARAAAENQSSSQRVCAAGVCVQLAAL